MLTLNFQGWFQYRAALDPDPTDEPWGVSGPTVVVAGEPPFDTLIRLQNVVAPRYPHQHDYGVWVNSVQIDGVSQPEHLLLGAAVDLLGQPRYEERGYIITYMRVPVDPFHLRIQGNGITLERSALWDITQPDLTIFEVSKKHPQLLVSRQGTLAPQSPVVAEATGIMDYRGYRQQRKKELRQMLKQCQDPVERAALAKRIDDLGKDDLHLTGITLGAQQFLGLISTYAYTLNSQASVEDPHGKLNGLIGTSMNWMANFWMGGYDVDSLFGYMRGSLDLPFYTGGDSKVKP